MRVTYLFLCLFLFPVAAISQTLTQMIKLIEPDRDTISSAGRSTSGFASAVAIDGDYAVVGVSETDMEMGNLPRSNVGAVYVFQRSATNGWQLMQRLQADDKDGGDVFGVSVGIHGDYIIVGADWEDDDMSLVFPSNAGAAYIFHRNNNVWTQQQKIVPNDRAQNDLFGHSVDIYGDYAIVGASQNDLDVSGANALGNAGAAYVFYRTGATWTQQQKIVPTDRGVSDYFGSSVAIDQDDIVVGAYSDDEDAAGSNYLNAAGSAYIFHRTGTIWIQQQKLVPNDRAQSDNFGFDVDMQMNDVIIGAPNKDHTPSSGSTLSNVGTAYIFHRSAGIWTQVQRLSATDTAAENQLGYSVAITSGKAALGCPENNLDASGLNNMGNAGSAYIFQDIAGVWSQQQKIVHADRTMDDIFGRAVAVSTDHLIIGAPGEEEDSSGINTVLHAGSGYVFELNSGNWVQAKKLVAYKRAAEDNFGNALAVSGNYAIVGAAHDDEDDNGTNTSLDAGSAYIFLRDAGGSWSFQQKLAASDRGEQEYFGWSVDVDSEYAVVGAWGDDDPIGNIDNAGAVFVFHRTGNTWSLQQKLVADVRSADDMFGKAVSIKGDYIIVGVANEDENASGAATLSNAGAAYIFYRNGTLWSLQQKIVASDRAMEDLFGFSVDIDGDYAICGAYKEDQNASGTNLIAEAGSAYIFKRIGTTWTQKQKIVASDRTLEDYFGYSVALKGDYAVVGAYQEDNNATGGSFMTSAGSAYVFYNNGANWTQQQKIVAGDREAGDLFGYSVAIDGRAIVVGAFNEDEDVAGGNSVANAGSAYVFLRSGTTWTQLQKIVNSDRQEEDYFGYAVALSGDYVLCGAYGEDHDVSGGSTLVGSGSAYFFESNAPLKVDIISFTGENIQQSVNKLHWQTGKTENGQIFEVERSMDGSRFERIAIIEGVQSALQYQFYDRQAQCGANYYRLRMLETDGSISHSDIIVVRTLFDEGMIKIVPIPATDKIMFMNTDASLDGSPASIFNMEGSKVMDIIVSNGIDLNISNWKHGIYFLRLRNGQVVKIIKQ